MCGRGPDCARLLEIDVESHGSSDVDNSVHDRRSVLSLYQYIAVIRQPAVEAWIEAVPGKDIRVGKII